MQIGASSDDVLVALKKVYEKYGQSIEGVINYTAMVSGWILWSRLGFPAKNG